MKLEEIHRVTKTSDKNVKIVSSLLDKKEHIKDNIYKITEQGDYIYMIIEEDKMLSYLYLIPFSNDVFKKAYVSKEIYVHEDHHNQGYATTLYKYIIKEGYTIVSDTEQTNDGIALWNKLNRVGTVKVYNTENGEILDKSDVPQHELYGDSDDDKFSNKYRLILKESIKRIIVDPRIAIPTYAGFLKPKIRYTYKQLRLF